jgi:hypothetical protein
MATFVPDKPIITKEPFVTVDNKFEPGIYTFRLIVIREDGTESAPIFQDVVIVREGFRDDPRLLTRAESADVKTIETETAKETKTPKETKAAKKTTTRKTTKKPRRGQGTRGSRKPEP